MDSHRLQGSLDNVTAQYKLDKTSSQAKDNRIKSLEGLVIDLGHDPSDIKATEKLIKKKNEGSQETTKYSSFRTPTN